MMLTTHYYGLVLESESDADRKLLGRLALALAGDTSVRLTTLLDLADRLEGGRVEVSVHLADDDDATDEHTALRPELGENGAG